MSKKNNFEGTKKEPNKHEIFEDNEKSNMPDLKELKAAEKILEYLPDLDYFESPKDKRILELSANQEKVLISTASLVKNFRLLLSKIDIEFSEDESLCEIGGPTAGATELDLYYSQADKLLVENVEMRNESYETLHEINPDSVGNDWFCISEKFRQTCSDTFKKNQQDAIKKIDVSVTDEQFVQKITDENNKFGIVTSYGMFGNENVYNYNRELGPDMSSREKRINIFKNIAGIMKKNGLFMFYAHGNSTDSGYWGINDEDAIKYKIDDLKRNPNFKLNIHAGFKPDELEEVGFDIITKLPYHDGMFMCQYK